MNKLEMNRAISRLEGNGHVMSACGNHVFAFVNGKLYEYDSIVDTGLNCMLRDKYEVSIEHMGGGACRVYCDDFGEICKSEFICERVVECILKSKGLYI